MDDTTCSMAHQQIPCTQWWPYKLPKAKGKDYKHAIWETVLYRVPAKQLVKGDLALHKAIWLGVGDSNGESFVGTTEGVIRGRTIRKLQQDFKYDEQLLNQQHGTPWAPKHTNDVYIMVYVDEVFGCLLISFKNVSEGKFSTNNFNE